MKKAVIILMILALFRMLAMPAFAAEATQDGLYVSLTAQQEGEDIAATLTLTNQSEEAIYAIELEPLIPEGYSLASDTESVDILEPGQSHSVSLRYIVKSNPETGDLSVVIWLAALIVAAAVLIFAGKPMAKRLLCIALCATLLLGTIGAILPAQAAEDGPLTVTETVTANGQQVTLSVTVEYLLADEDSDGDGVSNLRELELGTDPTTPDASFAVSQSDGIASVDMELNGTQVDTLTVKPAGIQSLFPEDLPGYMGQAYDFQVDGTFDSADISFRFDPEQVGENAQPVIYYFNEKTQSLEALETTVVDGVATATVEHFSTYILIDSTVYDGSFTWVDVWDNTGTYSTVEVVLVIDDSGSMGQWGDNNDPDFQRLTVARDLIDKLPAGTKIGVVWFATKTKLLTQTLTADREEAKAFLTQEHFTSGGSYTNMFGALNEAMTLFESTEPDALKTIITVTDGRAHDNGHFQETIDAAKTQNVRLYTVGLGGEMINEEFLQPLAEETGGTYHLAENADELTAIYDQISNMINLSADTDGDTIPDYYEDNLVAFNGINLNLDKTKADTDDDGIPDNKEVHIQLVYSEDRSQVYVKGNLVSLPTLEDSDYDGILDSVDSFAFDNTFTGTLKTPYAKSNIDCKMDYRWFLGDNTVYNPDLSKLSILFASEIYSGTTLALKGASDSNAQTNTSISQVMSYFGLQNARSKSLHGVYNDNHLTEVAMGYHNVMYGGKLQTVVAVTIRGTNGTIQEWSSNCDIGDISTDTPDDDWVNTLNHKGFDITATRVMREIDNFIMEADLHPDNLIYWVTGHSRGAAIANIVGANLEKAGETAFTYTFAAPNCTLDKEAKSYKSIFNVINEDDFVPCLPMEYWGYTTYGRATTTASILKSYEKEWEKLTGIGSYNPDENGMEDCVRDIGLILPEGSDPRVEAYRYTCDCHGDGSNDTITIKNGGISEDSREKAIAKIPQCALPYCQITRYDGGWIGGWDFECCQTPAYLMQLLAAFMGGEINAYRFAIELAIAKRYEGAKNAIISAGISGIEHPHYPECYYVLACHVTGADFS